jgi:hypothetical protein
MKSLAQVLAGRWCVNAGAVLKWLKARHIEKVTDLMRFGFPHSVGMDKALADFWEFST